MMINRVRDTWIGADGRCKNVLPKNGVTYTLKELQKYVGGYIEIVPTKVHYLVFVVNEEGRINGSPRNDFASAIAETELYGDVLFCLRERIK